MKKSIPDSNNISFHDLYLYFRKDVINLHKNNKYDTYLRFKMSNILEVANDDYYDSRYKNNKDSLLSFRNYGIHNSRRKKIDKLKILIDG